MEIVLWTDPFNLAPIKKEDLKSVGENISCQEHHPEEAFIQIGTNSHVKRIYEKIWPQTYKGWGHTAKNKVPHYTEPNDQGFCRLICPQMSFSSVQDGLCTTAVKDSVKHPKPIIIRKKGHWYKSNIHPANLIRLTWSCPIGQNLQRFAYSSRQCLFIK